jgi:putative tryptophan/tyrosine transport system substrate-binding protein
MQVTRGPLMFALALGLLAAPLTAEAQPGGKVWRVGYLMSGFREGPGSNPNLVPFSQSLHELGYVQGRNLTLEIRYAEGRTERFPALAAELVNLKVDVLVAASTPAALAAKQATSTIPIVMLAVGEPLQVKLVDSLAHPGGNVTGLSLVAPELAAKRLDLLKQALPKLSRVTVLWNSANLGMKSRFEETQAGAQSLGVALQSVTVQSPDDFEPLFAAMTRDRPESLLVLADTVTVANRQRTVDFAARNRVPAIYEARMFVDTGGLMSYGVDFSDHYRRAAIYVDKILKGAKPADLPVEQPTKFELVINMKTAKALGLTIPQSLLLRADEVIR